jgi:TolB protein
MNADGSGVRALTDHAGADEVAPIGSLFSSDHDPWSPDGTRIAFVNVVDFRAALHVVRADGTGHVRLVERGDRVSFEGWSPDGRVTFAAMADGATDLFLVNADGTGVENLTRTSDVHEGPALWVPRR